MIILSAIKLFIKFLLVSFLMKNLSITLLLLIAVTVLAITTKTLFVNLYTIPSSSMEDTLLPGDRVLVSKLHYGPRLPQSPFEVSWVNVLVWLNKKARSRIDSTWWSYRRLKGFGNVQRNDVVVFNFPGNERGPFFIKRCTGLPGDTLEIKNGTLICNSKVIEHPLHYKTNYRFRTTDIDRMFRFTDSMHISVSWPDGELTNARFLAALSQEEYRQLKKLSGIEALSFAGVPAGFSPTIYPYNENFLWSPDNFGPVTVPKKGMQIEWNERNFILYGSTINNYERETARFSDGVAEINGKPVASYTFRQNYYFMMGDNRHNSEDSRYWGFLPEEGIVGKAILVLFNYNNKKINLKRLVKTID